MARLVEKPENAERADKIASVFIAGIAAAGTGIVLGLGFFFGL